VAKGTLTLPTAAVAELCARVVVLLQCLLEIEDTQVVFPHGKVYAAQVVPEHTSHTFSCGKTSRLSRGSSQD
jgi:hypothetical protein